MALLEEAANSRGMLARDDYDARHWKDEVADTREQITSSRSMVINAVNDGMPDTPANQGNQTAAATPPANQVASASHPETKPVFQPGVPNSNPAVKPPDAASGSLVQKTVQQSPVNPPPSVQPSPAPTANNAGNNSTANPTNTIAGNTKTDKQQQAAKPVVISNRQTEPTDTTKKTDTPANTTDAAKVSGSMDVGSLINYATRQQQPLYPVAAKNMRTTGVVRVDITIDENGDVAEVQKTSGPPLLQGAAKDAIKKWRFKPFVRDGQPVKAIGFVNFNFAL
jgi:protein TonB